MLGALGFPAPPARAEPDPPAPAATRSGVLVVTLENLPGPGVLHLELHDVKAARARPRPRWEEALLRRRVPAQGGSVEMRIESLPAGEYAVRAFLDQNGNGELDRGRRGVPREPVGFSNDVRGRLGPPRLERAAFPYAPPLAHITLRFSSPRGDRAATPSAPGAPSDRAPAGSDADGAPDAREP